MFAPDQEKAASELPRVCRPGGKIGLTNWVPDSSIGELQCVSAKYMLPPGNLKSPLLWGTEARLRELFGHSIDSLKTMRRSYALRYYSEQHYLDFTRSHLGPVRQTFQALDAGRQRQLAQDALAVVRRFNRSGDATVVLPSDYLEVVAIRR